MKGKKTVLIILDGWGHGNKTKSDAIDQFIGRPRCKPIPFISCLLHLRENEGAPRLWEGTYIRNINQPRNINH